MLPKNTFILMKDLSIKEIQNVNFGDEVITQNGEIRKVTFNYKYNYNGNLNILKISNTLPISTSFNNKFLSIKTIYKNNISRCLSENKFKYNILRSDELNNKDIICSPIISRFENSSLTENLARLLGLFAAEGSFHRNEIIFSFGKNEEKTLAQLTIDLLKKEFGINSKLKVFNSKAEVSFTNKQIKELFYYHVGKGSFTKKLSEQIVFGSNNIKMQFLLGWLEGDGGIDKTSGRITGVTISPNLSSQIRNMLNSMHINNTIKIRKPSNSKLLDGRIIQGKHPAFEIVIPYNECFEFINISGKFNFLEKDVKFIKRSKFFQNFRIHKVIDKKIISYNDFVYALEIENENSYVANNIIIRN